jgi:hypothetical protein
MTATPTDSPALPTGSIEGGELSSGEKQAKTDANHLKLLVVFHWVLAGLSLVWIGFFYLHHQMLDMMINSPEMWKDAKSAPPPAEFFAFFQYFYLAAGTLVVVHGLANALSAYCLHRRQARMLSLIVAGFNCIFFPFGTALGVFTFIVLLRESVENSY